MEEALAIVCSEEDCVEGGDQVAGKRCPNDAIARAWIIEPEELSFVPASP